MEGEGEKRKGRREEKEHRKLFDCSFTSQSLQQQGQHQAEPEARNSIQVSCALSPVPSQNNHSWEAEPGVELG